MFGGKIRSNYKIVCDKELTMEKKKEQSKGLTFGLTVLGYVLILLFLFITAPVVCPPIVGQHTYTVENDYTGLVTEKGTLIYTEKTDKTTIAIGNIVAVDNEDGDRDVDCYYVDSNDTEKQMITLRDGKTVSYDLVKGQVKKKTPFFGKLSGILFHVWGVILDLVILAAGIAVTVTANRMRKRKKEEELRKNV